MAKNDKPICNTYRPDLTMKHISTIRMCPSPLETTLRPGPGIKIQLFNFLKQSNLYKEF